VSGMVIVVGQRSPVADVLVARYNRSALADLYVEAGSIHRLAARMGTSYGTARRCLPIHRIPLRSRGGHRKSTP